MAIIGIMLFAFSRQRPQEVSIKLDNKGLHVNGLLFPYKQLKDFWVVYNQNHQTINFNTVTYINRTIIVQLNGQDPDEAREFLLKYLPEHKETRETTAQRMSHKFKF